MYWAHPYCDVHVPSFEITNNSVKQDSATNLKVRCKEFSIGFINFYLSSYIYVKILYNLKIVKYRLYFDYDVLCKKRISTFIHLNIISKCLVFYHLSTIF